MYKKNAVKINMFIIDRRSRQRYYVLIKDFNTFRYNDTLHRGRKHLCRYCLQVFRTAEKLKYLIKD